jgi:hypothetical protein
MVNYSAISKRTEMISNGRVDIYIDIVTKEVIFEISDAGLKKQLRINIIDGNYKYV